MGQDMELNWNHTGTDILSATDMNRLEHHTKILADKLNRYGHYIILDYEAWEDHDAARQSQWDRIRSNVDALQDALSSLPNWREIIYNNFLGADQLNALEWDLQAMYVWIARMVKSFVYSNEFYGGEP